MPKNKLYAYAILTLILLATWHRYLFLGYLSEDFLVVSFHQGSEIEGLFDIFFTKIVDGHYWRPVVYISYRLTELFSSDAIAHRIVSLALYIISSITLFELLRKLKVKKVPALLSASLFAVIYTHESQVAWIPGRTDVLMSIFIFTCLIYLIKYFDEKNISSLVISTVLFILASLSKEHAFIAIFLPLIIAMFFFKQEMRKALYASGIFFLALIGILLFRYFVIGGSPFESGNFASPTFIAFAKNYFVYPFLVFFRPEELEFAFNFLKNNLYALGLFIPVSFILLWAIVKRFKKMSNKHRRIFLFGATFFTVLIVPALPVIMRWYVFMPSLGIFTILASMMNRNNTFGLKALIVIAILANIIIVNIRVGTWIDASAKSESILSSFNKEITGQQSIRIWGLPDKYERINIFKIAPNVILADKNNISQDSILSPIRCEYYEDSKFDLSSSANKFIIFLEKGRFFIRGSKSMYVFKPEKYYIDNSEYTVSINNNYKSGEYISEMVIEFKSEPDLERELFFNGKGIISSKNVILR